jgi:tetratricopeptide (TPR) repeat protein
LRYQSAAGLLADLKREKRALDPSHTSAPHHTPQPATKPGRRLLSPAVISTSAFVVIVLMLLLLKPWKLEIVPDQPAAAAVEDRLAVMYFENFAEPDDPRRLGEIAANLLITDLSESQFIQVVSSQRLYDILKLLDMEGAKVIDKGVATQVAQEADARWMLTGNLLQVEPQIVLTTQLVDVATGNAIASQQITGEPGRTIFDLIDQLTVEIKNDLALPQEALTEPDPEVVNITTESWDAYRLYLEGNEFFYKYMMPEAEERYRHALSIDTTFAMAHYGLSWVRSLSGKEQREAIEKARQYIDRASHKEQEFIRARYAEFHGDFDNAIRRLEGIVAQYPDEKEAYFRLGRIYQQFQDREKAITAMHKAIEVDSLFKDAYNVLAYGSMHAGNYERAIWAINKYIELAPDEPNVYDSRGDLYLVSGDLDAAIASFLKAIDVEPNYVISLGNLAMWYGFKGDYAAAEEICQTLIGHPDKNARSMGRGGLAMIALHQGRFQEALRKLDFALETDQLEHCSIVLQSDKLAANSVIYRQLADFDAAIANAELARDILEENDPMNITLNISRVRVAYLHALKGDHDTADSIARALQVRFVTVDSIWPAFYWGSRGWYDLVMGEYDAAVAAFEKSLSNFLYYAPQIGLARAHHLAGRLGDAVTAYEKALGMYDPSRLAMGTPGVKIHYWLGIAYEESGWTDKAIAQYREFLDIWKNADPDIAEIDDAKVRLARLKNASL